jgi:arginine/serine-rich splicing factor 4/5/6
LKDFARGAGSVIYADVSRTNPSEGLVFSSSFLQSSSDYENSVVEYSSAEDFDNAMKTLDGNDLNGNRVKLLDNLVS